jgi:hypothetical protein
MATFVMAMLAYVRAFLVARHHVAIETVALRQQLAVYKRKQGRPKLNQFDRLVWVLVRRVWNNWSEALACAFGKRAQIGIRPKPEARIASKGRRVAAQMIYSSRSIMAGSIRRARVSAGSMAAKTAARIMSTGAASILGSVGFTW